MATSSCHALCRNQEIELFAGDIRASIYQLSHIGLTSLPRRSTLSDANTRRSEKVFEKIYRDLYQTYKDELSSDSRKRQNPKWFSKLQIIDSTTISLFSNLVFKGVGRHPKTGKKKGVIQIEIGKI